MGAEGRYHIGDMLEVAGRAELEAERQLPKVAKSVKVAASKMAASKQEGHVQRRVLDLYRHAQKFVLGTSYMFCKSRSCRTR